MILTVIQISLLRLWNNKAELLLTFVVPILFFSIFAWIFGSRGAGGTTPKLQIALSNEANNPLSNRASQLLAESNSLRFFEGDNKVVSQESSDDGKSLRTVTKSDALGLVKRGTVNVGVVFLKADDESDDDSDGEKVKIEILSDSFDQVASQVVTALVQKAVMTAQSELMKESVSPAAAISLPITPTGESDSIPVGMLMPDVSKSSDLLAQPKSINRNSLPVPTGHAGTPVEVALSQSPASMGVPPIENVDVLGRTKANPVIAMYAAGIAVMFLLFSATTASGSLLEERENSTLERLLCSRMTMDHLLMGKWCYLVLIGVLQTTLMFVAGATFFGLNLYDHLDGFAVMTFVTASAAASFALMIAAMCKTRTQLGWVSTILILSMSALGGSMVPRYLMSDTIKKVGQVTFNAWALDGYNKIFWRELPLRELSTELGVLVTCGFLFIVVARCLAIRWDRG